ncbi:MAG: hypothetical protein JRH20_27390 [Deltaproteobacteria bacterium]|nr:hypothetical protein [Deltaproteobacteria bacterium]
MINNYKLVKGLERIWSADGKLMAEKVESVAVGRELVFGPPAPRCRWSRPCIEDDSSELDIDPDDAVIASVQTEVVNAPIRRPHFFEDQPFCKAGIAAEAVSSTTPTSQRPVQAALKDCTCVNFTQRLGLPTR